MGTGRAPQTLMAEGRGGFRLPQASKLTRKGQTGHSMPAPFCGNFDHASGILAAFVRIVTPLPSASIQDYRRPCCIRSATD